jgi:DNA-binding NtrC family response regulator
MSQDRVLIVEDEENERTGLAELLRAWGYQTETAVDGADGWAKVESWEPAIVLTDLKMPRMDGMQLLEQIAEAPQQVAVILLTALGSIDAAVSAMKRGAFDFIEKPVNPTRLRNILQNAARLRGAERELEASRRRLRDVGVLGSLVGSSKSMQEVFRLIGNGFSQHGLGVDYRRERHRQGTRRTNDSFFKFSQRTTFRGH